MMSNSCLETRSQFDLIYGEFSVSGYGLSGNLLSWSALEIVAVTYCFHFFYD